MGIKHVTTILSLQFHWLYVIPLLKIELCVHVDELFHLINGLFNLKKLLVCDLDKNVLTRPLWKFFKLFYSN